MGVQSDHLFEILKPQLTYQFWHKDVIASQRFSKCLEMHAPLWRDYTEFGYPASEIRSAAIRFCVARAKRVA